MGCTASTMTALLGSEVAISPTAAATSRPNAPALRGSTRLRRVVGLMSAKVPSGSGRVSTRTGDSSRTSAGSQSRSGPDSAHHVQTADSSLLRGYAIASSTREPARIASRTRGDHRSTTAGIKRCAALSHSIA